MRRLGSLFISLVLVAACTGGAFPTPQVVFVTPPPATATPTPDASPSPAPTEEPTEEPTEPPTEEPTEEPTEPPTAEPTAGVACGEVEFPPDLGNDHLAEGETYAGYSSNPPTSGPHSPTPTATGEFYAEAQPVEQLVQAMEHGAVVFWVNDLTSEQDAAARAAVNEIFRQGYEAVLWTPYAEMDAPFAMTAWGVLQKCTEIDTVAMQDFVDLYYGSGDLEGFLACLGPAAKLPACVGPDATPPAATPEEGAFPDADEAALLERVPQPFRELCERPLGEATGSVADVVCRPEDLGADSVNYIQYPDVTTMNEAYEKTREFLGVASAAGPCRDADAWPGEGTYTLGDTDAGRVLCTVAFDGTAIMWWTDIELNIESLAVSDSGDKEALFQFWLDDSGPIR